MTAQWESECHWTRLIDLEGETNFTLQNRSAVKGQKLGLCLWFVIFLSPQRVSPFSRGVGLRVLAFRSVYCPWGDMETTCSLSFLSFTETDQWTCLNSISTLSSGSQMLKHLLNYRPFYLHLFFSREENFPIYVAILEATEWCQRYLSLKFHIMASWQCGFKIKLSRLESFIIV